MGFFGSSREVEALREQVKRLEHSLDSERHANGELRAEIEAQARECEQARERVGMFESLFKQLTVYSGSLTDVQRTL